MMGHNLKAEATLIDPPPPPPPPKKILLWEMGNLIQDGLKLCILLSHDLPLQLFSNVVAG